MEGEAKNRYYPTITEVKENISMLLAALGFALY